MLKVELEDRHGNVASLQESMRAEQGDEWKSEHLQVIMCNGEI